ncbi:hypothetical protein L3Q82_004838 [Scortum barcoo]|uniref:Uncharacterized protein n=1 Tax=Scortum barcoo TaxID=214431 RepID=A0ACB8VE13_9TELE|nr:hypothetical protein L3Q82_004838 [Scortum barcoo]
MSLYIAAFIFPSILTSLPVPAAEKLEGSPLSTETPGSFSVLLKDTPAAGAVSSGVRTRGEYRDFNLEMADGTLDPDHSQPAIFIMTSRPAEETDFTVHPKASEESLGSVRFPSDTAANTRRSSSSRSEHPSCLRLFEKNGRSFMLKDGDKIYTDADTSALFEPAVGTAIKTAEYHITANMKSLALVSDEALRDRRQKFIQNEFNRRTRSQRGERRSRVLFLNKSLGVSLCARVMPEQRSARKRLDSPPSLQCSSPPPPPSPNLFTPTVDQVRMQLKKIKARKATGPDGISSRLLRDCADQLCQDGLLHLQPEPESGKSLPVLWKTSCVDSSPQNFTRPKEPNHFRPVALLMFIIALMFTEVLAVHFVFFSFNSSHIL